MGIRLLVVEDEEKIARFLVRGLREEGYTVEHAADGHSAWHALRTGEWDLVLLDWWLPDEEGLTLLPRFRQHDRRTPVLFLTARDAVSDRVRGLDAGADDYLTKPFSYVVLQAHLRALVRRGAKSVAGDSDVLRASDLILDRRSHRCARGNQEVELSRREFDLLATLLMHVGKAMSKEELLKKVWGPDFNGDPNIVEVYAGYLRKKIDTPFDRHSIETVRGLGYRLVVDERRI
jgi:two-component system copper resistance phosphate regulon response regulator CusR